MDKADIQQRVVNVVAKVLNIDRDMVQAESNFVFDLGAESTQSIELIAAFEEQFEIEMDPDEALQVQTVGGAVDFIAKHLE